MGLPALDIRTGSTARRPRLRLVHGTKTQRPSSRQRARTASRARPQTFVLVCVLMAGLALFGLGRVMLAARATEASIQAAALRDDIKAERAVGDRLEVDVSALTVPSRIEGIAGVTMHMGEATRVDYMELPADAVASATRETDAATTRAADDSAQQTVAAASGTTAAVDSAGVAGWLESVLEMAAGEAQVMLVGDVGLASSE